MPLRHRGLDLPWRPRRAPLRLGEHRGHEPAYSVLGRLARRAGVPSAREMAKDHGLDWNAVQDGLITDRVATLAGMDEGSLRAATFVRNPTTVALGDQHIGASYWQVARPVFCAGCVEADRLEDPEFAGLGLIRRAWWDLKAVHRCPRHGRRLDPTSLDAAGVRESPDPVPLASIPIPVTLDCGWEQYLIGRLGFGNPPPREILDRISVDLAIDAVALWGAVATSGKDGPIDLPRFILDPDLMLAGYRHLASEAAFLAFLDELWRGARITGRKWGVEGVYGRIYRWLNSRRSDEGLAVLRSLMRRHALSRIPLGPDPILFGEACHGEGRYSIYQAFADENRSPRMFVHLAAALGEMDQGASNGDERRIGFTAETVQRVRSFVARTITADGLRRRLAMPKNLFHALVRDGVLMPELRGPDHGMREHRFAQDAASVFLERLAWSARVVSAPPTGCAPVIAAARATEVPTSTVISALVEGRLRAVGRLRGVEGFPQILVSIDEVRLLGSRERPRDSLTLEEAAKRLGLNRDTVLRLAGNGTLRSVRVAGTRNRVARWAAETDVAAFEARYVSASATSKSLGIGIAALYAKLRDHGIERAFPKDECPQFLLRRADLGRLSPDAPAIGEPSRHLRGIDGPPVEDADLPSAALRHDDGRP